MRITFIPVQLYILKSIFFIDLLYRKKNKLVIFLLIDKNAIRLQKLPKKVKNALNK